MSRLKSFEMKMWAMDIKSYEDYKCLYEKAKIAGYEKLESLALAGMERIKAKWPNVKFN